ncbi:Virulence factors putative positive transcription regulator BvgA [compost metagenome]
MSRILIVDEQPVTRHAVRLLVESEGHEVVGEADSGPQALQLARSLVPDLVILELSIPGLGGLEVIQRLIALEQGFNILVLTTQDSKYFAGRCLQAGARGFVSKQQAPHELKSAVKALLNGQSYFPGNVLKGVGQEQQSGAMQAALSVRELTVLQLLARGFSNVAISEQLAISDKTVSTYKVRLMQKLQASSLVELVDIARRSGLIEGGEGESAAAQGAHLEPGQREQLELLQKMIDAVPGTLAVRDTEGRLLICNQAFVDITGVSREDLTGTCYTDLPSYSEEDGRAIQENYLQAVAQGVPTVFDRVFDDRRLGRRVLTLWAKPLHAADGRLIGMLCGSQNHSERDDLLRELNDTAQRMGAEERARTAFAATMSREVRGVFRGISAMIDLVLAQPVIDDTQREPLKVAHVMTTQLHGLFSDMRD